MNQYNERWTREKFLEYRKLKRNGFTHKQLVEHFGDDIYESGMFNKNGHILPYWYFVKINEEININPEYVPYKVKRNSSKYISNEYDYIISFGSNLNDYILCLMFYPINNVVTYNIVFTTKLQWDEYNNKLTDFSTKGNITDDEFKILSDIIGRTTNLNDVFPIFKKISYIIIDFYNRTLKGCKLSLGDTNDKRKIDFYRDIIKNSFDNITEEETIVDDEKYYIYKIN